jgi:uncharacterized protein
VNLLFADTFYFLALLHEDDEAHQRALDLTLRRPFRVLTTTWVLTELADGLCAASSRQLFWKAYQSLRGERAATILGPDSEIFDAALDLYSRRPDKDWSLTDCTSFVVMHKYGIAEALTADHHFEQAGFTALLK